MSFGISSCGDPDAGTLLVWMVDDHDLEAIKNEVSRIRQRTSAVVCCADHQRRKSLKKR